VEIRFDLDLPAGDTAALKTVLATDDAHLQAELVKHARAAVQEYIEAYIGRRTFTRGTDILEYRLALLAEYVYGAVPQDAKVALLFKIPQARSATLVKNTMSKFGYQLRALTETSAKSLLDTAQKREGPARWEVTINASELLRELNAKLAAVDPNQKPIIRVKDSGAIYEISVGAYNTLRSAYGMPQRA
jgi:hypothetical protein